MSTLAINEVRDIHGAPHTVVTIKCDGPGCNKQIKSTTDEYGYEWTSILGGGELMDHNLAFCTPLHMKLWCMENIKG